MNSVSLTLQLNSSTAMFMYANISGNNALVNITPDGTLQQSGGAQLIASDKGANRIRRLKLDDDGNLRLYSLLSQNRQWRVVWQLVQELCTIRGACPGKANICVPEGADNITCVCPGVPQPAEKQRRLRPRRTITAARATMTSRPVGLRLLLRGRDHRGLGPRDVHVQSDAAEPGGTARACAGATRHAWPLATNRRRPDVPALHEACGRDTGRRRQRCRPYLRVVRTNNDINNFTGMTSMIDNGVPGAAGAAGAAEAANARRSANIAIITALFAVELLAGVLSFWACLRKYSQYREAGDGAHNGTGVPLRRRPPAVLVRGA
ncbi:hypothetical protein GUJ93_ZPchr0012g19228 [Zizania palustris]|uniref:Uncharacterized protein n=1 Tax=Zizania palustris TaxID=103762 RepID=A0A8J6BX66_ZIZPA|nr:hypothetical protein GUJ93_ZPchr0012g19228 [Zizania palustris]